MQELVVKLIKENNKVTKMQIAKEGSVIEKTIERHTKKMTNVKYIGKRHS